MSGSPYVAAVLLNWNGWRDTIECLESLAVVRYPALDLYLCDNNSSDDSVERIAGWARNAGWDLAVITNGPDGAIRMAAAPARLTLIRNDANAGFARGTNIAIRHALASERPYFALWALNTDTVVDPGAVTTAVRVLEAYPKAASVQSILLRHPDDRVVDSAGIRLLRRGGAKDLFATRPVETLVKKLGERELVEVFGCCAASAFYRTTALQSVGLFDESLFQTNEDVDLACRLRAAGYTALLVAGSIVRHKGGVSRHRKTGQMWFVAHRAKLLVVARWWPRNLAGPAILLGAVRSFLAMLRSREVRLSDWTGLLHGVWRNLIAGAPRQTRRALMEAGSQGFLN